jgi:TRAP-type mannitol/chloroaromatic compound transport system permease large subunit
MAAYYLKGVAPPHVRLVDIFSGIMPYLGIVIFTMVLLYNFPGIALWLPEYLFGPPSYNN